MNFSEQLNKYINEFDCTSSELSKQSNLSATVISRYRNGERTPSLRSKQLEQLSNGLYKISKSKNFNISEQEIYNSLSYCLNDVFIDYDQLRQNFNKLIATLNINIADLSRFIGYDSSFLSKIRSGSRVPTKPQDFIEAICSFVVGKYVSNEDKMAISALINCPANELENTTTYSLKLSDWLATNFSKEETSISKFLDNLDTFDLNKYIKAIHFDEIKVPSIPFYKASSKSYYGIDEMKKGELDFFKATVLSKSEEPIFMCSDMPMEDMAKDIEFGKKWMFAIAVALKKGLKINIVHNLNRPFNEMMLGLESWIPLYMTGQVLPHYLKDFQDNVYCHLNYSSGVASLVGECINGYHHNGKYYLATNKKEVEYYRAKCNYILKKASPLMKIYREDSDDEYNLFIQSSLKLKGKRRRILSAPPIYTISDQLLEQILSHNDLTAEDIKKIRKHVNEQKNMVQTILNDNIIEDEFSTIAREDFSKNPISLFIEDNICNKKIYYTYEEYLKHLKLTNEYSIENKNYITNPKYNHTFKNIQVSILEKKWVIISKNTSPTIHFVIHHPKLRDAIENFVPPILEN